MNENFGASLREARERRGMSLRQIATATKISVAALERLERNDFSKLPGGIFSRSFVRAYAIEVGLDPDETVNEFLAQSAGEQLAHAPGAQPDAHGVSPSLGREGLASSHQAQAEWTDEFDFESRQRLAAVVLKLVLVSVPVAVTIIYFGARGASPSSDRAASEPPPPAPAAAEPSPLVTPVHDGPAIASTPQSGADATTPASASSDLTIEIAPSGDCWVQLSADGQVVMSRVLKPGERETRRVRDTAVLQVGDAAACAISINGRPAKPLGGPHQVRQVRITRDNYAALLR